MSHHTNVNKNPHKGARQTHLNKEKFNPNRHIYDHNRLDQSFIDVMTSLCCRRCCDQLQWKIDYGKYLPLERPRKCNLCSQKNVAIAYHHICQECSKETARCAKCQKVPPLPGAAPEADGAGPSPPGSDDDERAQAGEGTDEDKKKALHVLAKYAFVDEPIADEEFAYLQGLDVRRLLNYKRRVNNLRDRESRQYMRERERRTAYRVDKKRREKDGPCSDDELSQDSDEEIH